MSGTSNPSIDPVLERMHSLLRDWEQNSDRRAVFLNCYAMMTQNMLAAIAAGEFNDADWVKRLLDHFAGYYFFANDQYAEDAGKIPPAWRFAFDAVERPRTLTLQHLLLGVNAHINYDLIFALGDILEPEWAGLDEEQRIMRHADHCKVNEVIAHTVDAVQDEILDRYNPWMELADEALGHMDEWFIARMIADWRDEVWEKAVRWVESPEEDARHAMRSDVEQRSLHYANLFLLNDLGSLLK